MHSAASYCMHKVRKSSGVKDFIQVPDGSMEHANIMATKNMRLHVHSIVHGNQFLIHD